MTIFAVRMKKIRTKMGLIQAEFAAMVGISEEEVSLIEREKLTDIKLNLAEGGRDDWPYRFRVAEC